MTDQGSRLANNVLLFCRTLRAAGVPVGTGQVLDAIRAVACVGVTRREDVSTALRAVLVTDPVHFRLFDQAFHVHFRNPQLLERMTALLPGSGDVRSGTGLSESTGTERQPAMRRITEALATAQRAGTHATGDIDVDRAGSFSVKETLRDKDFDQMSLAEQEAARALLLDDLSAIPEVPTRRFRPHNNGQRYDLRRSIQLMIRNRGQLQALSRKHRRQRPPVLVLMCDVSGSMSQYSRLFLQFAHALTARSGTVHSFVFGTRLTNVSRRLVNSDVDTALALIANDVRDWDGGTRIAASLGVFNRDWGRRVLAQNAVVVLLSDGLERDTDSDLALQMKRLRQSCRQLIWLNPLLRYDSFAARAFGIRTMLPYVDRFLPAHNVNSLTALAQRLGRRRGVSPQTFDPEVAA